MRMLLTLTGTLLHPYFSRYFIQQKAFVPLALNLLNVFFLKTNSQGTRIHAMRLSQALNPKALNRKWKAWLGTRVISEYRVAKSLDIHIRTQRKKVIREAEWMTRWATSILLRRQSDAKSPLIRESRAEIGTSVRSPINSRSISNLFNLSRALPSGVTSSTATGA